MITEWGLFAYSNYTFKKYILFQYGAGVPFHLYIMSFTHYPFLFYFILSVFL